MVDVDVIKDWIEKGDEDFEFAAQNLKEGKPFGEVKDEDEV